MRLGVETDSYDLDGQVVSERSVPELDMAAVQAACDQFTGAIQQIPPMVSAVKVGGERLYKKARKGETVERAPRNVVVAGFDVLDYSAPDARVRITCSSGTYVRSLCHDVGQTLACGAVLASLRRLAVGHLRVGGRGAARYLHLSRVRGKSAGRHGRSPGPPGGSAQRGRAALAGQWQPHFQPRPPGGLSRDQRLAPTEECLRGVARPGDG